MANQFKIEDLVEKLRCLGRVFDLHPVQNLSKMIVAVDDGGNLIFNTHAAMEHYVSKNIPYVSFDKSSEEITKFIQEQRLIISSKKKKECSDKLQKIKEEKEKLELQIKELEQTMNSISTIDPSSDDKKFFAEIVSSQQPKKESVNNG